MKLCLWCNESLPKRRRKYCCDEHASLYFIYYISPLWWSCATHAALLRAEKKCEDCGSKEKLEVHHKIPLERWEARHNSSKNKQENLRVLCRKCHEKAHHPNAYHAIKIELGSQSVMKLDI